MSNAASHHHGDVARISRELSKITMKRVHTKPVPSGIALMYYSNNYRARNLTAGKIPTIHSQWNACVQQIRTGHSVEETNICWTHHCFQILCEWNLVYPAISDYIFFWILSVITVFSAKITVDYSIYKYWRTNLTLPFFGIGL